MKVTVVPIDKTIIVDGRALNLAFAAPADLHALQWLDNQGWLEFVGGRANQTLAAEDYATIVKPYVDIFQAEAARLDSCPGPAYEWDSQTGKWTYKAELDRPGDDYDFMGGQWVKIRFTKLAFFNLFTMAEKMTFKTVIAGGNMAAAVIHDSLTMAEYIDVQDPATIQALHVLADDSGGSVLTPDRAGEILAGVPHVEQN